MVWFIVYLWIFGMIPWMILAKDDGVHKEMGTWAIIITWPTIPLWYIGVFAYEKFDDWKWERDRKKYEKKNSPPSDNETPTA